MTTSSGEIDTARILSIVKGQKDEPGRVEGAINSKTLIGSIYNNTKVWNIWSNKKYWKHTIRL